jgi:hypothetical protein
VTPLKCACGAEAFVFDPRNYRDGGSIACSSCDWESPWFATEPEAIAAWNAVMRPRPKVHVNHSAAFVGGVMVGCITTDLDLNRHGVHLFGESQDIGGSEADCRAWLIVNLKVAGFDVRESEVTNA